MRPALTHPNVTLLHPLAGAAAGDQRDRHGGHRRGRRARRRAGDVHGRRRRRLLRRRELGRAAAVLGERRAPARARERVRPARAQLHVPQQPGRAGALQGGEPDDLPEDARAQRLLLRRRTASSSRWGTSRWSASPPPTCTAARSRCRPSSRPSGRWSEVARHAVDFWLSTEDLPRPENRVTLRRRRQPRSSPTSRPTRCPRSGCCTSSSSCSSTSACTSTTCSRATRTSRTRSRSPGVRAPGGDVPVRLRPGDVGARHRLPRARGRQPLRRRHELLPEHRRRQPGADGDGQRAARRRPPARAPGRRRSHGGRRVSADAQTVVDRRRRLRRAGARAGAAARPTSTSRSSTARTTICSSRCSTSSRRGCCRRGVRGARSAGCCASSRNVSVSMAEVTGSTPSGAS